MRDFLLNNIFILALLVFGLPLLIAIVLYTIVPDDEAHVVIHRGRRRVFSSDPKYSDTGKAAYFKIPQENIVIIHDDIDLVFGRIKIKEKGGDGGHKGVRSLMNAFRGGDFKRLRVGIGRGYQHREMNGNVTAHVLGKFRNDEEAVIDEIVARAREGAVAVICKGARNAMTIFNNKEIIISQST